MLKFCEWIESRYFDRNVDPVMVLRNLGQGPEQIEGDWLDVEEAKAWAEEDAKNRRAHKIRWTQEGDDWTGYEPNYLKPHTVKWLIRSNGEYLTRNPDAPKFSDVPLD